MIGLGIMAFVVFVPRTLQKGNEWPQIWHSFYFCFSKPVFISGLLVHLIIIYQYYSSRTYDIYYSIVDDFVMYAGCLVLSCLVGFIMTVLLELPCAYYQKELMNKIKSWNKSKENMRTAVSGETL